MISQRILLLVLDFELLQERLALKSVAERTSNPNTPKPIAKYERNIPYYYLSGMGLAGFSSLMADAIAFMIGSVTRRL